MHSSCTHPRTARSMPEQDLHRQAISMPCASNRQLDISSPCKTHANLRPSRIRDARTHARCKSHAKCVAGELPASEPNARSMPLQESCQQPHASVCKKHALATSMPTLSCVCVGVCKTHAPASSVPGAMCSLAATYAHL